MNADLSEIFDRTLKAYGAEYDSAIAIVMLKDAKTGLVSMTGDPAQLAQMLANTLAGMITKPLKLKPVRPKNLSLRRIQNTPDS